VPNIVRYTIDLLSFPVYLRTISGRPPTLKYFYISKGQNLAP